MIIIRRRNNVFKSVAFHLWRNVSLTIVITAVVFTMVTLSLTNIIQQSTIEQNEIHSTQYLNAIEQIVTNANRLSSQINLQSEVMQFASMPRTGNSRFFGEMHAVKRLFQGYVNLFYYGNYLLWFDRNDTCLNSSIICTDGRAYYGSLVQFGEHDDKSFFSKDGPLNQPTGFLKDTFIQMGKTTRYDGIIYHLKLYPYSVGNGASLFVIIDNDFLKSQDALSPQSEIFLLTDDYTPIYSNGADFDKIAPFITGDGVDLKALQKDNVVISKASNCGIRYISLTPKSEMFRSLRVLQWGLVGMTALLLIGALLISFIRASRNGQYLQSIIQTSGGQGNIYKTINMAFSDLSQDNQQLRETKDNSIGSLRKNFFNKLLRGELDSLDTIEMYAKEAHISPNSKIFPLVFSADISCESVTSKDISALQSFVDQWIGAMTENIGKGYVIPLEIGRAAVILNGNANAREFASLSLELADTILTDDNISIRCCITEKAVALPDIYISASSCMTALAKASMSTETAHTVMYADPFPNTESGYALSVASENMLFETIRIGNYEAANEQFSRILNEVIAHSTGMPTLRAEFENRLQHTFFLASRASSEMSGMAENIKLICDIALGNTLYSYAGTIIKEICKYNLSQNRTNTWNDKMEFKVKVEKLIDGDLSNPNLGLKYLAEKFGFAPNYFSAIFKENMGVNLSAYLEQMRMRLAKQLILTTDDKLESIAARCGYLSSQTFRTAYRRYFGVTPSATRESKQN